MKQLLISALLASVAFASPLRASEINVCPHTQYPTIQSGVDAATPGSRINVCAGTYAEQVSISKSNITLQAAKGAVTLVPPTLMSSPGYGFTILAPNVQITGFNITGFNNTLSAGIYVNHVNATQLTDNLIYGNCNGIFLNGATGSSISGNNVSQNPYPPAGAVLPQRGIPPPIPEPNCQIPNDSETITADGYGIQSRVGWLNQIARNDVEQNGQTGVQLQNELGGSGISRNTLFANDNGQSGSPLGSVDVRNSSGAGEAISISDNTIDRDVIGINLVNSDHITMQRNRITHMTLAINLKDSNRNSIDHNDILQNATGISTGILLSGEYNVVDHNKITNNDFGLFVYSDACPGTFGNQFDHNKIQNNPQGDVTDQSYPSTCTPPPPAANYTPLTYNFYNHNKCDVSTPSNICSAK